MSRPIRYELGAFGAPVDATLELRIEIIDREGMPHHCVVMHHMAAGLLRVEFRDEPARDGLYDLTLEECHRWSCESPLVRAVSEARGARYSCSMCGPGRGRPGP